MSNLFRWLFNKHPKKNQRILSPKGFEFDSMTLETNIKRIDLRKKYTPKEYQGLLSPYIDSHVNVTYGEYFRMGDFANRGVLLLRHDVDHDNRTAIKIAEWEADKGLRATYCLLHSAWYYGPFIKGRYLHSRELIECAVRLHELGHEINLHNNFVVMALNEGVDPAEVLKDELTFFREELGIPVTGTSTHGDRLCREYNFRNWELFYECCDDRFGGPRLMPCANKEGGGNVHLGSYSMASFGLEYEAYDVPFDVYCTDSGGNIVTKKNMGGRDQSKAREVIGVLTHPIWWAF